MVATRSRRQVTVDGLDTLNEDEEGGDDNTSSSIDNIEDIDGIQE